MKVWVYDPHFGGKKIPPAVRVSTERRILDYANKNHAGKFTRIGVRFRGALCYIDAYTEPYLAAGTFPPTGETRDQWLEKKRKIPTHLCRIRYFGDEDRWTFAWFNYSHEIYEPGFLISGKDHCTPEEAFETSAQFL